MIEENECNSMTFVGVGLCLKNTRMNILPGWTKNSYGYHSDDGNFFNQTYIGKPYGPKF